MPFSQESIERILESTLLKQSHALLELFCNIDRNRFAQALDFLMKSQLIFTTGVGKSGYIAGKIADTFSSVGSPAIFVRPEQLLHGSMILLHQERASLLMISKSGETQELLDIVEGVRYNYSIPMLLISAQEKSTLAQLTDVSIIYRGEECCGRGFVPTTSTTLSLVIGDALSMALMRANNLSVEQFANSHPGGTLGDRLRENIGKVEFHHD